LARAGHPVVALSSRRPGQAEAVAAKIAGAHAMAGDALVARCQLVVLAVPDEAVASVAAGLHWRPSQHAVHCSGALGLDALDVARAAGALRGCMHPLQTFPAPMCDPARFAGISIGVEADGDLAARLEGLCQNLGAHA